MIHIERATAMSAYFLEKAGGRMNDIKLAKFQYLAERESLITMLSPMVGDEALSLYHGPCLSHTLNLTCDIAEDSSWDAHIGFEPYEIADEGSNMAVLTNPIRWEDFISPADIEILDGLWTRFGHMDWRQFRDWCHQNVPEYTEVRYGTRRWITLEDIFKGAGDDPEMATAKANEVRYHERFESLYDGKIAVPV
ncbi:Panacea domain-containing protein [soil metagenome]